VLQKIKQEPGENEEGEMPNVSTNPA